MTAPVLQPKPVTLFVCTTCKRPLPGLASMAAAATAKTGVPPYDTPGHDFAAALAARFLAPDTIMVEPVECLSVCKRPLTIALSGGGRFGYVIGDLDPAKHLEDVVAGTKSYAATADGLVPWRERPLPFRKGVIARIPPIGFKQPEKSA